MAKGIPRIGFKFPPATSNPAEWQKAFEDQFMNQLLPALNGRLERPSAAKFYSPFTNNTWVEFMADGTITKSVNGVVTNL